MFSVSAAWINPKPSVEGRSILSDSLRPRGVVILQGELPPPPFALTRMPAQKSVFVTMPGKPPAPQSQVSPDLSPPSSPPHSDSEESDDDWRYEC
ncbi:hypothetical protein EBR66_07765 [bacterium]|nr:hypothetical protein [bacterium]